MFAPWNPKPLAATRPGLEEEEDIWGTQVVILVGTFVLIVTGLLLGYVLSQLVLQNLAFNFLTLLGTISLIIIFGTLYYVLFWQLRREPLQAIKS